MNIVPIPPTSLIEWTIVNFPAVTHQFCLVHLMPHNSVYAGCYKEIGRGGKHHLIMDNGAFELGASDSAEILRYWIPEICPQEVVLPDRMFMADETLHRSREFYHELIEMRGNGSPEMKIQGVVHGRNHAEWYECMAEFVRLGVDVIAIPKDYEAWHGGRKLLVEMCPSFVEIHLLGWERSIWEFRNIMSGFNSPAIRSMDSAKPFIYAWGGVGLGDYKDGVVPRYPGRPKDYFDLPKSAFDLGLVRNNMEAWIAAARI